MYTHESLLHATRLWHETSAIGFLLMQIAIHGLRLPDGAFRSPTLRALRWHQLALIASEYLSNGGGW